MSCKVHPQIIVSGWRKSVHVAQQALEAAAVDHSSDDAKFKEDLMNIARTTLSSKILVQHRDHFASLAVEAVLRLKVERMFPVFTLQGWDRPGIHSAFDPFFHHHPRVQPLHSWGKINHTKHGHLT